MAQTNIIKRWATRLSRKSWLDKIKVAKTAAVFLPFLEQNFPHLAENYRQRYQDRAFLPAAYGKRLSQLVARLREKYKITRAHHRERSAFATKWPVQAFDEQLNLF